MGWTNTDATAPFTVVDSNGTLIANIDVDGIQLYTSATRGVSLALYPPIGQGVTEVDYPAYVYSSNPGSGESQLYMSSPATQGNYKYAQYFLVTNADGSTYAELDCDNAQWWVNNDFTLYTSGAEYDFSATVATYYVGTTTYEFLGDGLAINGNYVPGTVGAWFSKAGTVAQTATSGAEKAVAAWAAGSSGSITWTANHVYRLSVTFGAYDVTATETAEFTVRVRSGVNSTTASQMAFYRPQCAAVGANVPSYYYESYFVPQANYGFEPGLTITRAVGGSASAVALYGDANIPCSIVAQDMGPAANMPALSALAVHF